MTNKYYKYVKKNKEKLNNKVEVMVDDFTFLSLTDEATETNKTISEVCRIAFKNHLSGLAFIVKSGE